MDPLETLVELANHFEITYTNFKDHQRQIWVVKVVSTQPNLKGEGETLPDAIRDLSRQQELLEFREKLHHASLGSPSLDDWKAKIKDIL